MKDKLLERLQAMDKAIQDQHVKLQQETANLHSLNGARQELVFIINTCDAPVEEDVVEESAAVHDDLSYIMCEAV